MNDYAHDVAISVRNISKCYRIYDQPLDRLKQALLRGRRHYFREFWALRDISLDIYRGETVGIIGRNGCGKSTLLQVICNTLTPTAGTVETRGRIAALLELGAGFNPEFSGRDNVYTNGAILGLSHNDISDRFADIVAFAELAEFIDQPVKTYSSGMFVRLAFAVAISVDPDILVVDEALSVGDEAFQRKCFARIEQIQRRGSTILFVSHGASTIVQLCSRAVLLDHGEALLIGSPKRVVSRYQKLLYAPPDKLPAIREEIRNLPAEESPQPQAASAAPDADKPGAPLPDDDAQAYFDPHMASKSVVAYPINGAEIVEPRITTAGGRRVNVLAPHADYWIRYRVRFHRDAFGVHVGSLIKTVQGLELSGITTPKLHEPPIDFVAQGSELDVAFRFRCDLRPGAYFANTGVVEQSAGQMSYLHRLVDVLMFRVIPANQLSTAGYTDLFLEVDLQDAISPAAEMAA